MTSHSHIAKKLRELFITESTHRPESYIIVGNKKIHKGLFFTTEGYHGRMTELSAGILRVKLKSKLNQWISRRREIAVMYRGLLSNLDVVLPFESEEVENVYCNYTIRVTNRDQVRLKLAEKGIETDMHYFPPLHLQPVYEHLAYRKGSLPITEAVSKEILGLPMCAELNQEQIEWVALKLEQTLRETEAL